MSIRAGIIIIAIFIFAGISYSQSNANLADSYLNSLPNRVYYWIEPIENHYIYDPYVTHFATLKFTSNKQDSSKQYLLCRSALQNNQDIYFYYVATVEDSVSGLSFIDHNGKPLLHLQSKKPFARTLSEAEILASSITEFEGDLKKYHNLYYIDNDIWPETISLLSGSIGLTTGVILIADKHGHRAKKNIRIITASALGISGVCYLIDFIQDTARKSKARKIKNRLLEQIRQNNQSSNPIGQ